MMIPDLNPLWVSTGVVALAEMGDKTQLLALILAARYQRPWPIILGILIATLVNHGLAGALGHWIGASMDPIRLQLILSVTFLFMAFWILIPDRIDEELESKGTLGVLAATFVSFFLAEMGDKTQIATIALAANQTGLLKVVLGTTLGMMIANVPMVFLGDRIAEKLPVRATRLIAALLFLGLAITAFIRTELDLETLIQDGATTLKGILERIA
jgi:putative Ca2+/H+ antiporter (TMEM165/GDT1 family)